jgi:hypothetical protein
MRVSVLFVVLAAALTPSRPVLADDGGGVDEAGSHEAAAEGCDDGSDCADAASTAEAAPVIACDGGLCDTLQGRPSCAIARRATGAPSREPRWLAGVAIAWMMYVARRARRGA